MKRGTLKETLAGWYLYAGKYNKEFSHYDDRLIEEFGFENLTQIMWDIDEALQKIINDYKL